MPEQALCKGMEKAVRREKQQPWSGTMEALLTWELVETVESSLRGSQSMCLQRPLVSHGSKESLWARGVHFVLFHLKYSWRNFLREIITLRIDWATKDKLHVPKMVFVKHAGNQPGNRGPYSL